MRLIAIAVAMFVLSSFAVSARAQDTASASESPPAVAPVTRHEQECAESFPARLADAKTGLALYNTYMRDFEKARPAIAWFEAHCRFLTDLEVAIRKIDDANAFVCDPSARGKPKGLTSALVLSYSTEPTTMTFQTRQGDNHVCAAADERAGRISLAFGPLTRMQIVELLCYQDERASCVKARETIAKLKATGKA